MCCPCWPVLRTDPRVVRLVARQAGLVARVLLDVDGRIALRTCRCSRRDSARRAASPTGRTGFVSSAPVACVASGPWHDSHAMRLVPRLRAQFDDVGVALGAGRLPGVHERLRPHVVDRRRAIVAERAEVRRNQLGARDDEDQDPRREQRGESDQVLDVLEALHAGGSMALHSTGCNRCAAGKTRRNRGDSGSAAGWRRESGRDDGRHRPPAAEDAYWTDMDPLHGSPWSAPGTVAGFAQSSPNETLVRFAAAERARGGTCALDIGCGAARNTMPLAQMGWNVLGVDLSQPMIEAAAARVEREGVVGSRPAGARADGHDPGRDRSIDLIVAHGIWNLARSGAEFRRAVREAARVARPGAALFVFTFSRRTIAADAAPVAGETFVFTQFSGQPQVFLTAEQLVAELGAAGFVPDRRRPAHGAQRAAARIDPHHRRSGHL